MKKKEFKGVQFKARDKIMITLSYYQKSTRRRLS